MSKCRKCGDEIYPGNRCRACAIKWRNIRLEAFKQTKAEGLVLGTPEFCKQLRKIERKITNQSKEVQGG